MELFAKTIVGQVEEIINKHLASPDPTGELRIFSSSLTPDVTLHLATSLSDFVKTKKINTNLVFKVGAQLWNDWKNDNKSIHLNFIRTLEQNGWVDDEDRLTAYRDMKLDRESGFDLLLILLVGVDRAIDRGSLKDFFSITPELLWKERMNGTFATWIDLALRKNAIDPTKETTRLFDGLLQRLRDYSAGDIKRISDFLSHINFANAQDASSALKEAYRSLNFWGLPKIYNFNLSRKGKDYLNDAIVFFEYQKYLKSQERKKALKKLDEFQQELENGVIGPFSQSDFSNAFADIEEFNDNLRLYIEKNDPDAKARLLKTNFAFLAENVLSKSSTTTKPTKSDIQKIDAPPLEAVLTAVWRNIREFKGLCTKKGLWPARSLNKIMLMGDKFRHDCDSTEIASSLLRGCLGGIDSYIHKNLRIERELEDHDNCIEIESNLMPAHGILYEKIGSGVPCFQFRVLFEASDGIGVTNNFQWQLPETQPYRNLWNMAKVVMGSVQRDSIQVLPVFFAPYYEEMFLVNDELEINRILKLNIAKMSVENLLRAPGINKHDPAHSSLRDLCESYFSFLKAYVQSGYFEALENSIGPLRNHYEKAHKKCMNSQDGGSFSELSFLLYKAFLLIKDFGNDQDTACWADHLRSAIITGLHPSTLEMLKHREVFLMHAFQAKTRTILQDNLGGKSTDKEWLDITELAQINYPLFGLIVDNNGKLDTNVNSYDIVSRVGYPEPTKSALCSKILIKDDTPEDDDISDTELFRESRESDLVSTILRQYSRLNCHARDGLSILVLNVDKPQSMIAGINSFLKNDIFKNGTSDEQDFATYHVTLTLYSASDNTEIIARYLREWEKRWTYERRSPKSFYGNCKIHCSHRVISDPSGYAEEIKGLSEISDIAILPNFMSDTTNGNSFRTVKPYLIDWNNPLKFPIVETPSCPVKVHGKKFERNRVISNRQFSFATLHSEMGAAFKSGNAAPNSSQLVISRGNLVPWRNTINALHEKAVWVACLDPLIDEKLMAFSENNDLHNKREIIGFASGFGSHGQLNYTISTEKASLHQIEVGLRRQLGIILGPCSEELLHNVAHRLVFESKNLSGLSLVNATGPSTYVYDLIGKTITWITRSQNSADVGVLLCDEMLSLDTFPHWFYKDDINSRPDLLRIEAYLGHKGRIIVRAQVIEVKLRNYSISAVDEAAGQIENGLSRLAEVFAPRISGLKSPIDSRYWRAQLQRIIATKSHVDPSMLDTVTIALENLVDGDFDIGWQAFGIGFWRDLDSSEPRIEKKWPFMVRDKQMSVPFIGVGLNFLKSESVQHPCFDDSSLPDYVWFRSSDLSKMSNPDARKIPVEETPAHNQVLTSWTDINQADADTTVTPTKPVPPRLETPITKKVPDKIYLGDTESGRQIYWEFGHKGLNNRHILIFGQSGSGKTYAIQCLLCELAGLGQNSVIIDYTNGFENQKLEPESNLLLNPTQHLVLDTPLPINPFRIQPTLIAGKLRPEKAVTTAQRVASVFSGVYQLGDQQKAALYQSVKKGLDQYGEGMNLDLLVKLLNEQTELSALKESASTLLSKITPFVDGAPFGEEHPESWLHFYDDTESHVHIIQLVGCAKDFSTLVTEFALIDLYSLARAKGDQSSPKVIVLDEIQNLDHSEGAPLSDYLREGRKFGISAILATQTLRNLKEDAQDRLFQAAHKLFFRPADTEVKEYAKILARTGDESQDIWVKRLMSLDKGECYSLGPSANLHNSELEVCAFKIKITSLPKRMERINRK